MAKFYTSVIIGLFFISCQTSKKIIFEPASKDAKEITASILELGSTEGSAENLGKLPVEVEIPKLQGRSVKLEAVGFDPQYWIMPDSLGEKTTVQVRMRPVATGDASLAVVKQQINDAALLLLKSYKALVDEDTAVAIELADRSSGISDLGPAPMVVKALALWKSGQTEEARTLIASAKSMYPTATELTELLEAIEEK